MSETTIIARRRSDGTIVRVMPDGTERPFPNMDMPMREMTDEEIEAAALADPDAQPLTPEQLARARPVSRTKKLRWSLGLTQEEFAARFRLSLATLRDWEQGRSQPDQAASAYLDVIARAPETIMQILDLPPDQAAGR
jgi:putative transcriptional regulator